MEVTHKALTLTVIIYKVQFSKHALVLRKKSVTSLKKKCELIVSVKRFYVQCLCRLKEVFPYVVQPSAPLLKYPVAVCFRDRQNMGI